MFGLDWFYLILLTSFFPVEFYLLFAGVLGGRLRVRSRSACGDHRGVEVQDGHLQVAHGSLEPLRFHHLRRALRPPAAGKSDTPNQILVRTWYPPLSPHNRYNGTASFDMSLHASNCNITPEIKLPPYPIMPTPLDTHNPGSTGGSY